MKCTPSQSIACPSLSHLRSAEPRANECLEYRRHPLAAMGGGTLLLMICLWALSPKVLSAFLVPGLGVRRFQGGQAEGGAGGVAVAVGLAVGPGSLELAARAGALVIDRTAHTLADLAFKGDAARGFAVGSEHCHPAGADTLHQLVGDSPAG